MSIVTQGLGGNTLITRGYGGILKKILKAVSRLIPKKRKHFILKVPVDGSPVHPFEMTVTCDGEKDFRRMLFEILEDEDEE